MIVCWVDSEEFDLNKYTDNISKGCVLKVDLEYPKDLWELHNDYSLAPDNRNQKRSFVQLPVQDCWSL